MGVTIGRATDIFIETAAGAWWRAPGWRRPQGGQRHDQHRRAHYGADRAGVPGRASHPCARADLARLRRRQHGRGRHRGAVPVSGRCSMTGARSSAAAAEAARDRGSPVLLARCHISSIGLASVSRQVCGRHSLTPSGLPARAGGPGRRGCRIRSRPSAATGPARRRGQQDGAAAVGAVSPRGHGRFRIGAPGAGDDLPFCRQHKTNTTPGSGKDQHGNNTDKTVLPGTRRHAC
jgi:hypothetical protein